MGAALMPLNIEKENNLIGSYDWKILRGQEAGKILQGYLIDKTVYSHQLKMLQS